VSVLRGCVIGTGYFSQFHFDAWKRMEGVELVACCDTDADKAEAVAREYDIPATFTSYQDMLADCRPDFVDIVTRPDTHVPIIRDAAATGTAIICQKPLAPDMEQVQAIARTVADSGVRFMVHENFRFQPWYREIRQLLDTGTIGDRLHTISFRNRAGDGWGDDAYLARQPYFQTMEKFLIFEAGIHTIDTFRYLAGEIDRVWCTSRRLNPVIAGEDTALGVFQFADGGTGLYDANRYNESTAENPRYTFGELLVEGSGGSIRLYDDGRLTVQPLGKQERDHVYDAPKHGFAGDCVLTTQQHFIHGLATDSPFETDIVRYLRSIAVQEAMYRSARSGAWEVPE